MSKLISRDPQKEIRTVTTEVVTPGATLFFTQEELDTLNTILSCIGGSPYDSPRKHVHSMWNTIVKISESRYEECLDKQSSRMYFNDFTPE